MTSYSGMFPAETEKPKTDLFGEVKQQGTSVVEITHWLNAKGHIVKPGRIEFILGKKIVDKLDNLSINDLGGIGETIIQEASEMNQEVDMLVLDLQDLKSFIEGPRQNIAKAAELISENIEERKGFLSFFVEKPKVDLKVVTSEVRRNCDQALDRMERAIKYRIQPFADKIIIRMNDFNSINQNMGQVLVALDFMRDKAKDQAVKDHALRRKEMFEKAIILMDMNLKQLAGIMKICDDQKRFLEELKMNIIPAINTVLRGATIAEINKDSLKDLSSKLKGML